jgi:hypothetical protein
MVVTVARVGVVLVVIVGLLLAIQTCRLNDLQWKLASTTLPSSPGWTPPKSEAPKIEGVPRGNILATVEGKVRYLPRREAPGEAQPCDLDEIDAVLGCRVEVVQGAARLATWGTLMGFGQVRELPRRWAGEVIPDPVARGATLEVVPEDTAPTESKPPEVHVAVLPRQLQWEARALYVVPTRAVRLEGTRMFTRHLGVAASATVPLYSEAGFDAGVGLAVRF